MAVTTINSGLNQEKGITYSVITDTSVDFTGVTNDTYFYNLEDDLPYYKNSSGTIIGVFEEGGSGGGASTTGGTYNINGTLTLNQSDGSTVDINGVTGQNIYNTDGTLTANRTIDLGGNGLTFDGSGLTKISNGSRYVGIPSWNTHTYFNINNGSESAAFIMANSSTAYNQDEFSLTVAGFQAIRVQDNTIALGGGFNKNSFNSTYGVNVGSNGLFSYGDILAASGTNELELDFNNYPKLRLENSANEWWLVNLIGSALGANGDLMVRNNTNGIKHINFKNSGQTIIGNSSTISGNEDISLQGLTYVDDYLIQKGETSQISDGDLVDNSFAFHMNGNRLAGRYKDNLSFIQDLLFDVDNIYTDNGDLTDNRTINLDGNTLSYTDDSASNIGTKIIDFQVNGALTETYNFGGTDFFSDNWTNSEWRMYHSISLNTGISILSTDLNLNANFGSGGFGTINCTVADNFNIKNASNTEVFKVEADGDIFTEGTQTWSGTFINGDGDTVTVLNGLITNVAP